MRLISWNTASRVRRLPDQVAFLADRAPDIVALQEVTGRTREVLRPGLSDLGLRHQLDTFELGQDARIRTGARAKGILVASRYELTPLTVPFPMPWPERVISCEILSPLGPLEFQSAHIPPGSSHGWLKIETFEGLLSVLAKPASSLRILCGDFNSPQEERSDGVVVTWGQRIGSDGRPVTYRGYERWHAAERATIVGLREYDLEDVFRLLHGYQRVDYSWVLRRKGKETQRRFDHIFAAAALRAVSCEYLHDARKVGLSDHSPIEAVFEGTGAP